MNFTHATQATQNLVIDSSGIDITDQNGDITTLRDGKVGIGTSNPDDLLEVYSSGNAAINVKKGSDYYSKIYNYGELNLRNGNSNNEIVLRTSGNSSYLLNTNVGIGTSSPQTELTVKCSDEGGISIIRPSDNYHWRIFDAPNNTLTFQGRDSDNNIMNNCDDLLCLHDSGRVGIGTNNPQANLDVRGSARFYTSSMLVSEFQTNAGVARFAGIMAGINGNTGLYTGAASGSTGYRIYLSYDLRDLYNATYGTTGPLPGAYDYSAVAGYPSHFYATWQTPTQEVLDNILKLVPSVTFDNGNVGIGTNTPEAPLDVNGWRYSTGGGLWSFFGHNSNTTTLGYNSSASNNALIAIKSSGSIWITGAGDASYFLTSSDSRIKTEIELVNDKTALEKVNRIECKEYHYKDKGKRESVKTIGFIAQEVRDVLPNAIILQTSFVPDELRVLDNAEWNTLEGKYSMTIPDLDLSSNNTGKCRFYVSNDPSGNDEIMREVTVESDNKTFVFDESWNNVFFYGKEVNDFHTIDKNKIFQLHHPAIQELSRLNDEKTQQIAALQQHNEALETELSTVKTQLATLEAKVNELLAKNA